MASINAALAKVKHGYQLLLDADLINQFARKLKHSWRSRLLGPADTVQLFLLQILHGNLAINGLRRIVFATFTDSAYVQARQRLPVQLFVDLLAWINTQASTLALQTRGDDSQLFHGHRVHTLDGSNASTPDTASLQKHFGQPSGQKPGCGFPAIHLLYLIDIATGMILNITISPLFTHDLRHALAASIKLAVGDLIMGDRAFASFAHIASILGRKMHVVMRLHQRIHVPRRGKKAMHRRGKRGKKARPATLRRTHTFKCKGRMMIDDFLAVWIKPVKKPVWMTDSDYDQLPGEMKIRIVEYHVLRRGYRTKRITLVTTLTNSSKYEAAELAALYQRRWEIEGHLRELKTTMKMDVLHTKTVDGVTKELLAYAMAYNLVRLTMLKAAKRQGVAVERVSFVDALRWLSATDGNAELSKLILNPDRPGRVQPRAVKRRPKSYKLLTEHRREWLKKTMKQGNAA